MAQNDFYDTPTQTRERQKYKFKRNRKMAIICPAYQPSEYPYQGIGIKLGDPFAVTYKLYIIRHLALTVDGGYAPKILYQNYHRERFDTYPEYDSVTYSSHNINQDIVVQTRLLYHRQVSKRIEGFDWYIGIGWQWRFTEVEYEYITEPVPDEPEIGYEYKDASTFGPEATLGLEYSYFDLPIAAFLELNFFHGMDTRRPMRKLMGGIGLRYIF